MAEKKENRDSQENVLENIAEGMTVYDREGRELGKVDQVHAGRKSPQLPYTYGGTLTGKKPGEDDEILAKVVEELFDPMDNLHKELQKELYVHGFMRMLTHGLEGEARYIRPHQIRSVSEGAVHLHDSEEELKK
jgi:hypothetical protein